MDLLLVLVALSLAVGWLWWVGAMEGIVEGAKDAVALLYPSRPLSRRVLPRRLLRAAKRTLTVGVSGAVLVPTRIEIAVNPDDVEPFVGATDWLCHDIAEAMRRQATANGWVVPDGPRIVIVPDPQRPVRMPRAKGYVGGLSPGDIHTMERPAVPAPPADGATTAALATAATANTVSALHLRLVATGAEAATDLSALLTGNQTPLVLGRSREADLRVRDRLVSARHCSFSVDPEQGTVQVEDLGSTNGTFVGDQPVSRAVLGPGETLRVGGSSWRVEVSGVTSRESSGAP